jgi:hypothetical protein
MAITHRITAAPSSDVSTQAGLVNLLEASGFKRVKTTVGVTKFFKNGSAKKPIETIKKVWKSVGTEHETEILECNGVKIYIWVYDLSKTTYISWHSADFKKTDNTDIYNVTKYHPAWMYVQEYLDLEGAKGSAARKAATKKAVDEYMEEFGYKPDSLREEIVKRTREKTVHRLYGTD